MYSAAAARDGSIVVAGGEDGVLARLERKDRQISVHVRPTEVGPRLGSSQRRQTLKRTGISAPNVRCRTCSRPQA